MFKFLIGLLLTGVTLLLVLPAAGVVVTLGGTGMLFLLLVGTLVFPLIWFLLKLLLGLLGFLISLGMIAFFLLVVLPLLCLVCGGFVLLLLL